MQNHQTYTIQTDIQLYDVSVDHRTEDLSLCIHLNFDLTNNKSLWSLYIHTTIDVLNSLKGKHYIQVCYNLTVTLVNNFPAFTKR